MKGPTPRMMQRAMIDRTGKVFNTTPEREFQAFVNICDYPFKMNESRDFLARDRLGVLRFFSFQLDFVEFEDKDVFFRWKATGIIQSDAKVKTDLEVDGRDHKDANDPWKDHAKNNAGVRVIHIPGYLCRRKMWPDLKTALAVARKQPDMTVYLDQYSR